MTKEMFEKINQAGLFDYYKAKVSDDSTNPGIFVPDKDGHLIKITMDNLSDFFDIIKFIDSCLHIRAVNVLKILRIH